MAQKSQKTTVALDKRLAETARLLTDAAKKHRRLEPLLELHAPDIVRQIRTDADAGNAFTFWSLSRNFDEHADAMIVHPAILRAIGRLAGINMRATSGHAGLMHTYGYLLSTLATPFGYKRDRWVSPALDQAFGFRQPTLRAVPTCGTLLANASYIFGRIAMRDRSRELSKLEALAPLASKEAVEYDYNRLRITRITEHVKLVERTGVYFKTDLVTLPKAATAEGGPLKLLVYSTVETRRAKLVTGFPVTMKAADDLLRQSSTSRDAIVRARYNAFVKGMPSRGRTGTRRIEASESGS